MGIIDTANPITSRRNPMVLEVVRLRKRSSRRELNLTIVEEVRCLERALDAGWRPLRLFFDAAGQAPAALLSAAAGRGAELYACAPAVMEKLSFRKGLSPVVAIGPSPGRTLTELPVGSDPLLLAAESIEKPGNAGPLLRLADGAGADGVIFCGSGTDLLNPSVVRSSTGAVFCVPAAEASTEETLAFLADHNIRICAAVPGAGRTLYEADLTGPLALVVGSEHAGLSDAWIEAADLRVNIPMQGVCDSLNVSASAAILLYEALRQRR